MPRMPTDRRSFLTTMAGGTAAVALNPARLVAHAPTANEQWLAGFDAGHRVVMDIPRWNDGYALPYARAWIDTMRANYGRDVTPMLVVRHFATPMVLGHALWDKYPLGELFNVTDPVTRAPARRNIYLGSSAGDIPWPNAALDRLQEDGAIIVVCALALRVMSARPAARLGISADEAAAEWAGGVARGVRIAPSGMLAVSRAQEVGAAYSFAG
jgi:hypothetical protein